MSESGRFLDELADALGVEPSDDIPMIGLTGESGREYDWAELMLAQLRLVQSLAQGAGE